MPTVPGDAFADVAPSTAPLGQFEQRPMVSPQTSEAAFGAPIGQGLSQASDVLFQHAQAMQGLRNEATAREASIVLDQKVGQLWASYNSLTGKAAVDGFPAFQASLEAARQDAVAAMPNPDAQRMLANQAASIVGRYTTYSGSYAAGENKKWQMQSHAAFGQNAVNQAVQERNNPDAIGGWLAKAGDSAEQFSVMSGEPPEMAAIRGTAARGDLLRTVIGTLAAENPAAAQTMFDRYRGQMDGASVEAVTRLLEPKMIHSAAMTVANAVLPVPISGGAGVTAPAPMTAGATANAQQVHDLFVNKGWSDQASWGLAANGHWESGNTPAAVSGDGGAGTFQWTGPRRVAYTDRYGHDPSAGSLAENVDYADWELRNSEKTAGDAIAGAPDAVTAARLATTMFLRPAKMDVEAARRGNTAAMLAGGGDNQGLGAYPDKSALMAQALKLAGPDPRVQEAAASEVERRINLYAASHAQATEALRKDMSNLIPALWQGNDLAIPEANIRHLFPPEKAAEMIGDARMAAVGGQIVKGLQFATPDEQAQTLHDFAGGLGTASTMLKLKMAKAGLVDAASADPGAPETPALFTLRQKLATMVGQQLQANQKALAADPASYAMGEPSVSSLAQGIDPKNPATFDSYAAATVGLQKHLGVADQDTWLLPVSKAQRVVTQLLNADPKTTDVGAQLDALAQSYGDVDANGNQRPGSHWPEVWHDIVRAGLPPEWAILGSLPAGPDRMGLQRALQAAAQKGGVEQMRDAISQNDRQAIDGQLAATLQPFMRTVMIPGLTSDPAMVNQMRNAVRTFAYWNVMNGESGANALTHAANAVMRFDYQGPDNLARAPLNMGSLTSGYGYRLLNELTPNQIAPAAGGAGMRPADRDAALIAGLQRTGTWITNQRGDGWDLWSHNNDGSWSAVNRPDGSRFGFKFSDIPKGVPVQTQQLTVATPLPGLLNP